MIFEACELLWIGFQPLEAVMALVGAVTIALALSLPSGVRTR